ncbi:MAG: OadG family protein [Lachnospiraceae bacterium]|nr:OadG family protein [Lachnospiraceae bacterium]
MMKNIKKAIVLMMFAALSVTAIGCAKDEGPLPISEMARAQAEGIVSGISNTDDASSAELHAMEEADVKAFFKDYGYSIEGKTFLNGLDGWLGLKEEFGQLQSISEPQMSSDKDSVTALFIVKGSTRDGKITVIMDKNNKITSITTSADYTVGENMEKAGLNTVLGMGTTFVILIFLSLIISLFELLPGNGGRKTKEAEKSTPVDNVVSQIAEREELAGDDALVAVITAAIAAYEGGASAGSAGGDGFVVRSIRRHY